MARNNTASNWITSGGNPDDTGFLLGSASLPSPKAYGSGGYLMWHSDYHKVILEQGVCSAISGGPAEDVTADVKQALKDDIDVMLSYPFVKGTPAEELLNILLGYINDYPFDDSKANELEGLMNKIGIVMSILKALQQFGISNLDAIKGALLSIGIFLGIGGTVFAALVATIIDLAAEAITIILSFIVICLAAYAIARAYLSNYDAFKAWIAKMVQECIDAVIKSGQKLDADQKKAISDMLWFMYYPHGH